MTAGEMEVDLAAPMVRIKNYFVFSKVISC